MKSGLSILIPTYNEEKNVEYAIQSISWADEIFVLDSFSSDKTLEIANRYSKVKIVQHKFENYSKQKNWALDNLPFSNEWILILDADEQITTELRREIINIISQEGESNGYYINRRFFFLGKWIRHCGWYPSWNLRLFKKGKARYEERSVNEHMLIQGKTGYLREDMIHENHRPIADWIEKHNRYSNLEAQEFLGKGKAGLEASFLGKGPIARKRALRDKIFNKLPLKPLVLFVYLYFIRLGFLDGSAGFIFCCLRAIQQFHIDIKIKEIKNERK